MLLTEDKEIDLFVASKIGSFKHIKYNTQSSKNSKKSIENLVEIKSLTRDDAITCMVWGNEEQTEILIGRKNQQIQVYNTLQGFTKTYTADFGTGDIVGLGKCKRRLVAALTSGIVQIWGKKEDTCVHTGAKLDSMRLCGQDTTLFATGGEENDLKVWRIGDQEPVFTAKNLPHDWLQLRRPVWVTDLTFLTPELVAVCSRHGYVRLYDTRAQRRPVCNVDFENMAATCITRGFDDRQVYVGFGRGQLHQVDLRRGKPDKGYKGAVGAVTSIALHTDGLIVSTSLDRHVRVHARQSKELLYKQYLTSKQCHVLVQSRSSTPLQNPELKEEHQLEELEVTADDMDGLFDTMETIGEKPRKKHIEALETTEAFESSEAKKMKPSTEGSTAEDTIPDEAIAKLLRSTEKQKRRMEKRKREKKAKSIYHNA
ncbi:WD repeat-containing protein 74 [Maniola hyperantus]|uniref:WD repeat-containing protein 74 n=1 Tax=Aphantopus hyperantus TaxID=2795564 RepID=UPI0015686BA4|nr:WD repeat-containing protein 74 [Maniola hyperantus]